MALCANEHGQNACDRIYRKEKDEIPLPYIE